MKNEIEVGPIYFGGETLYATVDINESIKSNGKSINPSLPLFLATIIKAHEEMLEGNTELLPLTEKLLQHPVLPATLMGRTGRLEHTCGLGKINYTHPRSVNWAHEKLENVWNRSPEFFQNLTGQKYHNRITNAIRDLQNREVMTSYPTHSEGELFFGGNKEDIFISNSKNIYPNPKLVITNVRGKIQSPVKEIEMHHHMKYLNLDGDIRVA